MSDDDLMPFDPTKKKKKKKKVPFDVDASITEAESSHRQTDSNQDVAHDETATESVPQTDDLSDMDFIAKKKKKKKKVFDPEPEEVMKEEVPEPEPVPEPVDDTDDFDISKMKKKKKKKKIDVEEELKDEIIDASIANGDTSAGNQNWHGTDREYSYDELLNRVFDIMREKNPDMVAGERKKFTMRPPHVVKVGTKKSSFINFKDICRTLHRQPKHVLDYLCAELGTSGSVDGNDQLIIKGKFQQKQIENVLRGYIKEYVTCHTCRSPDTILQKDTRLFFLQCESCGSRCSVTSIKSGFQAVTGKRAAMRAKTT